MNVDGRKMRLWLFIEEMKIAKRLEELNEDEEKICKLRNDANEIKKSAETDLTALDFHVKNQRA